MATKTTHIQMDKPTVGGDTGAWGGMLNADLDLLDTAIMIPRAKEATATPAATVNLDLSTSAVWSLTPNQNTTINVTNEPADYAGGASIALFLVLRLIGAGAYTITWEAAFKWPGGTAPTLSTGSQVDVLTFISYDNGTTWLNTGIVKNVS